MQVVVTLYHFVHPSWFESLGGFLKNDNIHLFVAYAAAMFRYELLHELLLHELLHEHHKLVDL